MAIELRIVGGEYILLDAVRVFDADDPEKESVVLYNNNYGDVWMNLELSNKSFIVNWKDPRIIENNDDLRVKLDKLVIEFIEASQSGTDNTESQSSEVVSPYDPDKIKVNSKQFSVKLIEEMIENGDIDFTPDFQRNFVWNNIQKSRLIESILLRIPLPMFYFSEDEEGKISVVDGLQRLTTIKEFIDNKFPLKNLEYLMDSCEGKYYSSKDKSGNPNGKPAIDPKYFRWFNMTQFSVNVIDPTSPPKVKYDIFRRINTGGKPLNNQEIRNCLAGKALRETLKEMVNLPEFMSATDYSIKPTRMDDQEVALRFIMFSRMRERDNGSINNYNGYMDTSLDDLTEELLKSKKDDLDKYIGLFSNSMKNAEYLFGSKYAFRKITPKDLQPDAHKQLINKALFASWSVLLADYDCVTIRAINPVNHLLNPLANLIKEDRQLMNYLSYGTNGRANLLYAFSVAENIIRTHLNV
jgi:hypothetical protein